LQKNDDVRLEVEASDQSLFVVSLIEVCRLCIPRLSMI
jgi:hypothetical protein